LLQGFIRSCYAKAMNAHGGTTTLADIPKHIDQMMTLLAVCTLSPRIVFS
jgi:hypothetical protein